ncbi:MAG TPA: SH3 domain-containing protein, partial [Candidatus Limnocylindria bacterium]|nr:SH3 domain-containing protein [Candidatus Limnocylindria bacterium]
MRRAAPTALPALLAIAMVVGGCLLAEPIASGSPSLPPSVPAAASVPPESESPAATVAPEATPGADAVPRLAVGSGATTNAPGLRVRSRPGTAQRVITTMGVDHDLLVGMGPVIVEGLGWYQVRDADADEPAFREGWVAAGFEPDPFLIGTAFAVEFNPYLAGYAHDADGEFGPVLLPGADVTLRWIASPPTDLGCSFAVDLRPGGGQPVPAIRSTVGAFPAPGEVFSDYFAGHPELIGPEVFVIVTSDCSWALTFVRPDPAASPTPSPAS